VFCRISPCPANLSVLLEEEVKVGHSNVRSSFIDSTDSLVSDKSPDSIPAVPKERDSSAEVWTLSHSDGDSRGSSSSFGDSGHSSTLDSLVGNGKKSSKDLEPELK